MSTEVAARRGRRSAWEIQRAVLFALLIREIKSRVGGQWVGAIWTVFEPLAHTLILMVILEIISGGNLATSYEFPVFLATGLIPFFLFQNLANRLMDGIEANLGLFSYRQVKPIDVLLARSIVEACMNLVVYAVTLGLLGWLGYDVVPVDPLGLVGVNLLLIAFGLGFGTLVAVLTHDRPRFRSLIRMVMMPLYITSGVIFQVDLLPREYLDILLWNPILHLVELSRHSYIDSYALTSGVSAFYPFLFMLCCNALGLTLYQAKRRQLIAS